MSPKPRTTPLRPSYPRAALGALLTATACSVWACGAAPDPYVPYDDDAAADAQVDEPSDDAADAGADRQSAEASVDPDASTGDQ